MAETLEQTIRRLAAGRCEYCRLPEAPLRLKHVLDHIVARQHGGPTELENLALCCGRCNLHKGPNVSGIDSGALTHLFNPRNDVWEEHFRYAGPVLDGLTPVGRVTIQVLAINDPQRVAVRRFLLKVGMFG